jgi:hypothetical protein
MNVPLPSHHGQSIVEGDPPRLEITVPVPRHGEQEIGSVGASVATGAVRLGHLA